jgi:hypothetical protein
LGSQLGGAGRAGGVSVPGRTCVMLTDLVPSVLEYEERDQTSADVSHATGTCRRDVDRALQSSEKPTISRRGG